ncbi:MAG: LamG domain-containing protein [bacterium]|nr:LamG domain-containing protein [bacterium]
MPPIVRCAAVLFLAPGLHAPAAAQALTNQDDCANSGVDVRAGNGVYGFDTIAATTGTEGQSEGICVAFGTSGIESDIWFTYVATVDGVATLNTCNTSGSLGDTKLAVYPASGGACPVTGTAIACSDDECGLLGAIDFSIQAGESFVVQLGSFPGAGAGTGQIEVFEQSPRTPELRAHYKLDETAGTTAADSSGQGNPGTYAGGYTLGQPGADAGTNTSVGFNGSDARAAVPTSPALDDLRSDLTIAAWVRPAGYSGLQRIFANSFGWGFGLSGDKAHYSMAGLDYTSGATIPLDVWTHLAVVVDAANDAMFYVDGASAGTIVHGAMSNDPAPTWFVGTATTGGGEFWDGRLDDVQVYAGALTDADVLSLFQDPGSIIVVGGPIGSPYCSPAFPNSTGVPAEIRATGSDVITANEVTLTATNMPPGQFGYFLVGETQGVFNPPGSSGLLCLIGNIGRYNQLVNIIQGPTGSIDVDLGAIPVNPPQAVMSGETWNFQCWFRDNVPQLTSNFTDGVAIVFQ